MNFIALLDREIAFTFIIMPHSEGPVDTFLLLSLCQQSVIKQRQSEMQSADFELFQPCLRLDFGQRENCHKCMSVWLSVFLSLALADLNAFNTINAEFPLRLCNNLFFPIIKSAAV